MSAFKVFRFGAAVRAVLLAFAAALLLFLPIRFFVVLSHQAETEIPVDYAEVVEGSISRIVRVKGRLRPKKIVTIKSIISGKIIEIVPSENQSVEADEILAKIEPEIGFSTEFSSLEFRFEQAARLQDLAGTFLSSQEALYADGVISDKAVDDARMAYEEARMNYEILKLTKEAFYGRAGRIQEEEPEKVIEYDRTLVYLRSPITGTILQINKEEGEMIYSGLESEADRLAGIMVIADLSEYVIEAAVNETDIAEVFEGQGVYMHFSTLPGEQYEGVVNQVSLIPEEAPDLSAITYKITVTVSGAVERLRTGMSCWVDIVIDKREKVLTVPIIAMIGGEDAPYVYVREDGGHLKRNVSIGLIDDCNVEVVDGLRPGEYVCLAPLLLLEEQRNRQADESRVFWRRFFGLSN